MINQPIELTPQGETARRIAACVSAFEGIPTDRIEGKNLGEILAGEVRLNGAGPRADGCFGFEFSGGICQLMAEAYAEQFRQSGAINYLELLFHHSDIGPLTITMQRVEGLTPAQKLAQAEAQRDALAAENAYLLPKAASELSNAWVLHKYWVGIHAALMHLRVGRIYEVEQWLQNTVAGPGIEAPNLKLTEEIDAWAIEQSKASISHSRALEIMKAETPATDAYLNALRAEGIIMFASKQLAAAGDLESTITLERLMLDAEEFAGQLRTSAGKDGE